MIAGGCQDLPDNSSEPDETPGHHQQRPDPSAQTSTKEMASMLAFDSDEDDILAGLAPPSFNAASRGQKYGAPAPALSSQSSSKEPHGNVTNVGRGLSQSPAAPSVAAATSPTRMEGRAVHPPEHQPVRTATPEVPSTRIRSASTQFKPEERAVTAPARSDGTETRAASPAPRASSQLRLPLFDSDDEASEADATRIQGSSLTCPALRSHR